MELLIITENKNSTSDELFHPLIDTAKQLSEKAYLIPLSSGTGMYHEFQIGMFEPDSLDLVVNIPHPGSPDEMKLVVSDKSKYFELATNQMFDVVRLAIIKCENDELLFRFCRTYLKLQKDHQISFEGRHDYVFKFEDIVGIEFEPYWYEKFNKEI